MRIFRNIEQLKLYKSLDTLKILTFWKIIQDKNILLLDFDYFEGKKYSDKQKNEIEQLWNRLYDEYYVLIDDPKSRHKMDKSFKEFILRSKINDIRHYIDFLISLLKGVGYVEYEVIMKYEQEAYKSIKLIDSRIKLDLFGGINNNIEYLNKFMNGLINKYNIDINSNNDKTVAKEINNVYEVVASAESWLERSLKIDDMVVAHWIAIEKQVKQKQKASLKNGKR